MTLEGLGENNDTIEQSMGGMVKLNAQHIGKQSRGIFLNLSLKITFPFPLSFFGGGGSVTEFK